jgi:peptidoglycan/xylan/chitin deacetylase (PgdA/CDA1 family)
MLLLSGEQQNSVLAQLREWASADSHHTDGSALSVDQVVRLASGDLIEIGAHSVTHSILNTLPLASQKSEIHQSKAFLEKLLGHRVNGFSYPNGAASEHTQSIVREAQFVFACASHNDVARRGGNPYYLPRFWVGDWDGRAFCRWLQLWLHGPIGR